LSWTVTEQLKFYTLFVIKRLDRQIVLRFGMAEVRINANTNEL